MNDTEKILKESVRKGYSAKEIEEIYLLKVKTSKVKEIDL